MHRPDDGMLVFVASLVIVVGLVLVGVRAP